MMAAGARLVRFSLIIFVLRCSNTLRRLYDWGYYTGTVAEVGSATSG